MTTSEIPKLGLYRVVKDIVGMPPSAYENGTIRYAPIHIMPGDIAWVQETENHHGIAKARIQVKRDILVIYCFDVHTRMEYIPYDHQH